MNPAVTTNTSIKIHANGPTASRAPLASLAMAMLLSSLGTSIANVGLPALAQTFGASLQAVQWVVLAYLLSVTALIVGVGRLADMVGRRRMLLGGIALFALASAACGLAPSLPMLVAARAAQGLGAAAMMAIATALAADTAAKGKTGSAMGMLGTMSAVGTALGPSLGGALIAAGGWRAIFLALAPIALAALLVAWRSLPADRAKASAAGRFDGVGTLLLAATLSAYALAMTGTVVLSRSTVWGLLGAAAVAGAAFLYSQARAATPLIRLAAFRDATFATGLATNALVATVMMSTLVVGPFYLMSGLGLGASVTGLAMSVGPVISALSGVPAGRLVDRFGTMVVTMAGLAAMAVATLALALMPSSFGLAGYIAAIALLTPGYQLFQAANNTAVMAGVAAADRGVMSGMLNLSRNIGLVTGASAMGAVFATVVGTAPGTPEFIAGGMRASFAVATVLVLLALALVAWVGRRG